MQTKRSYKAAKRVGTVALAIVIGLGTVPSGVAYAASSADLSSQLSAAQTQLDSLSQQLEIAQAKVEDTTAKIDDTNEQIEKLKPEIEEKQAKVSEAQQNLAQNVTSSYKSGGQSLTNMVLSSTSFSDIISNIFYANKVAEANSDQIAETNAMVDELKQKEQELSDAQTELQTLLDNQKEEEASLESAQREAESYVNGLSSELQSALKAEREAEAKKQQEAAAKAAAEAAASGSAPSGGSSSQTSGGSGSGSTGSTTDSGNSGSSSSGSHSSGNSGSSSSGNSGNSGSSGGGSSLSGSTASIVIGAARTQLGVSYSLGAMNPGVAMDCSGLTKYAYAQAGISIPHSSRSQYSLVCSKGLKTRASQLSAGDLVFYQRGGVIYHVAIYIGGGNVIHANGYGQGVVITSYDYDSGFCGGGSPV